MTITTPNWVSVILQALAAIVMFGALFGLDLLEAASAIEAVILLLPPLVVAVTAAIDAIRRAMFANDAVGRPFASLEDIKAETYVARR